MLAVNFAKHGALGQNKGRSILTEMANGILTVLAVIFPLVGSTATEGGVVQSPSHVGSAIN